MKRTIINNLFILIAVLFSQQLMATHNRAGEITYRQLGDLLFEATITTYTKTSSIQADRDSLELFWGDGTSEWVVRSNGNGTIISNDIKKNVYTATHTYPGVGGYRLYMTDPNRNGGVLNVNYPYSDQVPFHLETYLYLQNPFFFGHNSSPILTNPPIDNGCMNNTFTHNPMAIDPDCDSLAYELIVPYQFTNTPVNNYQFPNSIGGGSQIFNLDPKTGTLTWNSPQQAGEYTIAFWIKEYRSGFLISKIVRDMQITIKNCNNLAPNISQLQPIIVEAGDTIQFNISASDANNNNIKLSAASNILMNNGTFPFPATVSFSNNNSPNPSGTFDWITTCNHVKNRPYYVMIRAADDFQYNSNPYSGTSYKVQEIWVLDTIAPFCISSTYSPQKLSTIHEIQLFPNPTREQAQVKVTIEELSHIQIQVMSLTGRLMENINYSNQKSIQHQIDVSRFASGIYLVRVIVDGEVQTKKLIVH